ncbi:MAG: GNAT family N-acetyltransferase [Erysipelotrichaceae bacterium]|nr:GNAT family N-acetyltransferase [Erysipelotrichaceae bacterium]
MLYLKAANLEDVEKEYAYMASLPKDENGFLNRDFGVSREEFERVVLPRYIHKSLGIELPEGHVPSTEYFLWDGEEIVGLFRIRHYLNDVLRHGAGHIGYGIHPLHRGKGYGTKGLALAIELAWGIIPEDEIYMSVNKDNPASLRVMIKNGAYIHHEDEKHYCTRIRKC